MVNAQPSQTPVPAVPSGEDRGAVPDPVEPSAEQTHAVQSQVAPLAGARSDLTFAQLTTLRVGGPIATYVEAHSEDELVAIVQYADEQGIELLVLGGGSNLVPSDEGFAGIVVRDARTGVRVDLVDSCGGGSVTVVAGHNWDDFVVRSIAEGWVGIESLIGIPGTVGAAPVQNIGAYGAEVSNVISSVRVYDRGQQRKRTFALFELGFGYRDSIIKQSMTRGDDTGRIWGPSPRYVVLDVSFQFRLGTRSAPVEYSELARRLGIEVGDRAPARDIAQAVLELRAGKGMLVDAFDRPMVANTAGARGTLPRALRDASMDDIISGQVAGQVAGQAEPTHVPNAVNESAASSGLAVNSEAACGPLTSNGSNFDLSFADEDSVHSDEPDFDRWSAGSFFTNPIIAAQQADQLPQGAPRYPVHTVAPSATTGPSTGAIDETLVKTSAAWLIQHAGFDRGFGAQGAGSRATLSTRHTLALTNRGGATAADIRALAQVIRDGVYKEFGIQLEPEPVVLGQPLRSRP